MALQLSADGGRASLVSAAHLLPRRAAVARAVEEQAGNALKTTAACVPLSTCPLEAADAALAVMQVRDAFRSPSFVAINFGEQGQRGCTSEKGAVWGQLEGGAVRIVEMDMDGGLLMSKRNSSRQLRVLHAGGVLDATLYRADELPRGEAGVGVGVGVGVHVGVHVPQLFLGSWGRSGPWGGRTVQE